MVSKEKEIRAVAELELTRPHVATTIPHLAFKDGGVFQWQG